MLLDEVRKQLEILAYQVMDRERVQSFIKLSTADQVLGIKCLAFIGKDFKMVELMSDIEEEWLKGLDG